MWPKHPAVARYLVVYVLLLLLLGLTVEAARRDLGSWNFATTLLIAAAKATLIACIFMHVWSSELLIKIVVVTSLLGAGIMFCISFADYATRSWDAFESAQSSPTTATHS